MRLKKLLLIGDKLLCSTRSTSMDWTEDHDFELLCNYTSSQVVFEEFVHELEVGLSAIHPTSVSKVGNRRQFVTYHVDS